LNLNLNNYPNITSVTVFIRNGNNNGPYDNCYWDDLQFKPDDKADPSPKFVKYYYVKDHLGSIRQTLDEQGNIIVAQDYFPFGDVIPNRSYIIGTPQEKYKFTGKERDVETNLDYFGARYYNSKIGRWLSVDPMSDKYLGWTPYNYSLNCPLIIIDPNGKWVNLLIGAAIGVTCEVAAQALEGKTVSEMLSKEGLERIGVAAFFGACTSGASAIESVTLKLTTQTLLNVEQGMVMKGVEGEKINYKDMLTDAVTGFIGSSAGHLVESNIKLSSEGKSLFKDMERTAKIAANDGLSNGRAMSANIAKQTYQTYGASRGDLVQTCTATGLSVLSKITELKYNSGFSISTSSTSGSRFDAPASTSVRINIPGK
jgi:RHS repeat-associated protein